MAWRNQGITGSNNIPLGSRRRFGGSDSPPPADDGGYNPTQPETGLADASYKRGRSPERRRQHEYCEGGARTDIPLQPSLLTVANEDARRGTAGEMLRKTRPLA